jgi:hypothetical protein
MQGDVHKVNAGHLKRSAYLYGMGSVNLASAPPVTYQGIGKKVQRGYLRPSLTRPGGDTASTARCRPRLRVVIHHHIRGLIRLHGLLAWAAAAPGVGKVSSMRSHTSYEYWHPPVLKVDLNASVLGS